MQTISPDQLLGQLRWRYACKQFDAERVIDDTTWDALETALVLSPSSFGLQPWKFFVITDQTIQDSFVPACWNQAQVANCSHLVVLAIQKDMNAEKVDRFIRTTSETQGRSMEELTMYRDVMVGFLDRMTDEQLQDWAKLQSYIALGQFMTSAALVGVDTCPMEGFLPNKVDDILGLEAQGLTSAVLCPAGYRSSEDKYAAMPKVRYSVDEMVVRIT